MQKIHKDESGVAHLVLVVLLVLVVVIGAAAYWRVSSSNKQQARSNEVEQSNQLETLPEDLANIKSFEEVEKIAGVTGGVSIVNYTLENKDGRFIYTIKLSNGKKIVIDAVTGEVLSEETEGSPDSEDATKVAATISLSDAQKIASSKHSSPIKKIELEREDDKATYKVEYQDGSKLEINATTGAIVKSELKNESER